MSLTITSFGAQITNLALPLTAALLLHATPLQVGRKLPGIYRHGDRHWWVDKVPSWSPRSSSSRTSTAELRYRG